MSQRWVQEFNNLAIED